MPGGRKSTLIARGMQLNIRNLPKHLREMLDDWMPVLYYLIRGRNLFYLIRGRNNEGMEEPRWAKTIMRVW